MRHFQFLANQGNGRRIFVGDVHGCVEEFLALLQRANYEPDRGDVVCCVGDMLRKGPSSLEVLRLCRSKDFLCVRGNHEEKLLRDRAAGSLSSDDSAWTSQLTEEDWNWLLELPYSIDFPMDHILVVHAGLVASKALEEHTPLELTTMRYVLDKEGIARAPVDASAERWVKQWHGPRTIVFGHDAVSGLQVEPFAFGLDTGAVYGGKLTALCVTNDGARTLYHEESRRVYCKPSFSEAM